jgi:hypothetical protein
MEKLGKMSLVLSILVLLIMAVGLVNAAPLSQAGIPGEPELEPEIGRPGERELEPEGEGEEETEIIGPVTDGASLNGPGPDEANPAGTAIRINFEVAGHSARRGLYVVQELGGNVIASWYALDGWSDSGWFENVEISAEFVKLRVLYYPGPNTNPTEMRILNPAAGSKYGWASHEIGHAIEVAWPDVPLADEDL